MSRDRAIQFLHEAEMTINATKDRKIDGTTYDLVAGAVIDALKALSDDGKVDSIAQQPRQRRHYNIVLKLLTSTHRLAVPCSASLKTLRRIIADRVGMQPNRQRRLVYNGAQIGGYDGEDGAEGDLQLYEAVSNKKCLINSASDSFTDRGFLVRHRRRSTH